MWEQVITAVNVSSSKQAEENKTTQKVRIVSPGKENCPYGFTFPQSVKKETDGGKGPRKQEQQLYRQGSQTYQGTHCCPGATQN